MEPGFPALSIPQEHRGDLRAIQDIQHIGSGGSSHLRRLSSIQPGSGRKKPRLLQLVSADEIPAQQQGGDHMRALRGAASIQGSDEDMEGFQGQWISERRVALAVHRRRRQSGEHPYGGFPSSLRQGSGVPGGPADLFQRQGVDGVDLRHTDQADSSRDSSCRMPAKREGVVYRWVVKDHPGSMSLRVLQGLRRLAKS